MMTNLNGRLAKLEAVVRPPRVDDSVYLKIALRGFEDVGAWLGDEGPAPDVHQVDDLLRIPFDDGIEPGDVEFFRILARLVLTCAAQRYQDLVGNEPPDKQAFDGFLEVDPIAGTWVNNALFLLQASEATRRGDKANFVGDRVILPVTPWCTEECQRRHASREYYPEWWQACLEFEKLYPACHNSP